MKISKNKFCVFFILLLVSSFSFSQLIRVNSATDAQSAYSLEDLVKKVLIKNGDCYTITNITSSPNFSLTDANRSFGYFNKGTSVFPFQDGILISSGRAVSAGNTASGTTMGYDNGNVGDADLGTAMISSLGSSFNINNIRNSAYIQFDFVPLSNEITFNYIMASEEYSTSNNFPCSYADAFALLIKKVSDPSYANIAKLSNNDPVLVTYIRQGYGCADRNVSYFAGTNTGDSNFNGRTIPITAHATVEPGQTYRIKMIIADYLDEDYDSGVFLQGGSFDLGLKLVNDTGSEFPLVSGSSTNYTFDNCNPDQPITLTIVGGDPAWNWIWRYQPFGGGGFTTIPGANTNTYLATQPGYYRVQFSCSPTVPPLVRNITINDVSPPNLDLSPTLTSNCTSSGTTYYNLHNAESLMTTATSGVTYTYYLDQTNWNSNIPITEPQISNFPSSISGQTILVKINYGTCDYKATLTLNQTTATQPTITATSTSFCEGGSVTLTSSATTGNLWSNGATTQSITVSTAGNYSVTVSNGVCSSSSLPITISMMTQPNAGIDNTLNLCTSDSSVDLFTLLGSTAQTGGSWSPALASGTGLFNPSVDTSGNYTYTVLATAPCTNDTAVVNVTVNPNPTASISTTDSEICTGTSSSIVFTGSANATVSYTINGGATQSVTLDATGTYTLNTGNLTADTTYALVSVALGSCSATLSQSVTITVDALPTASITAAQSSVCNNTSTTITFTGTPNATVSYTINGGATQIITLDASGNGSISTGNLSSATTYALTNVSLTSTGCSQTLSQSVTVSIYAIPTASISNNGPICIGSTGTVTITGTANATVYYTIDGGATQSVPLNASGSATLTTTPLSANTTYTLVSVTSSDNCSNTLSGSSTVVATALPTASISTTDSEICTGTSSSIVFTGSANATVSYTINGGATQSVTLDATGTYTLNTGNLTADTTYALVSVALGSCSATLSQSVTITVDALPTASISAAQSSVCNNTSTTITFTGTPNATVSYTINGGATQIITLDASGNGSISTGNLSSATTYALTNVSLTSTGCSQTLSQSVTVSIYAIPTASISNNGPICIGSTGTVTITGTANATVYYTIDGGATQSVPLNASGSATLTTTPLSANTTYTLVSVTSSDNCSNTLSGSSTVVATALPTASISTTDSEICTGTSSSIVFTGSANATVSYTINGGATQTVTLDATGNYTLSTGNLTADTTYALVSVALGSCSATLSQSVTITVVPLPTISGTLSACVGNTSALTGSGTASTINPWVSSNTGIATVSNTGVVQAISAGTVNITYTNSTGCANSITFTVNPLPSISSAITPIVLCDDNFDGTYSYNLNNVPRSMYVTSPNNYNFNYYTDMALSNEVSGSYDMTTLPHTLYVKIADKVTGCFGTSTLTFVSGNATPLLSSLQQLTVCDDDLAPINDGKHSFNLTSVSGNIHSTTTATFEYYTSLAAAQQQLASGKITTPSAYINTVNPQTIYVRVQETGYCASFAQIQLMVNPIPYDANIETPPVICDGQTDLVRLEVDDSFDSYSWTDEQGNQLSTTYYLETNQAGTYYVTMTDGSCTNTQQIELTSYDIPYIADVQYGNGYIEITGAGGVPPYEYTFDGGLTWSLNNTFYGPSVDASGNQISYNVGIRNAIGKCEGDYQPLSIINITSIITPDGNNQNEQWTIKGLDYISTAHLRIYDRYGKLIYDAVKDDATPELKWDGSYLGRNLPTTTYWYTLEYSNPENTKSYRINGYIVVKDR